MMKKNIVLIIVIATALIYFGFNHYQEISAMQEEIAAQEKTIENLKQKNNRQSQEIDKLSKKILELENENKILKANLPNTNQQDFTKFKPPPPPPPQPAPVKYAGSKKSEVFHDSDCHHVGRILPNNLVFYESSEHAIKSGKRPCKDCRP